jgi:hypothetical protein
METTVTVDPDEPPEFVPEAPATLPPRLYQEAYVNGYDDGRADERIEHSDRCPHAESYANIPWWRDRKDGLFPQFPPLSLTLTTLALSAFAPSTATNCAWYGVLGWTGLAIFVRLSTLVTVRWVDDRRGPDKTHDEEEDD